MWELSFITEEDFAIHVKKTILKYGEKLKSFNLGKFNQNKIDPIKLIFDKLVYNLTWEEIVKNEIYRQRDKSNNNDIGYFHQNMFHYIKGCSVPASGWDIIYENPDGIMLPDGVKVKRIYVELKNKHNTMNSASSARTFMKMQNQILTDDSSACFLVEVIAKNSQNVKWKTTIDKQNISHKLIRRVSIDKFYSLITGQEDSFYKLCMAIPSTVIKVVESLNSNITPEDTVFEELIEKSKEFNLDSQDLSIALSIYLLGFDNYIGFKEK